MSVRRTWKLFMVTMVAAVSVPLFLSLTAPISAGVLGPLDPQAPQTVCGECIIYGIPVVGQMGVPMGVYQINTCTGATLFIQSLLNALNLAVADSTHLFVGDNGAQLFLDDITTILPSPLFGLTSANASGMSEGGRNALFDVDQIGQLHSLLPQPPTLVGVGTVGGAPVSYLGDVALSPTSCHLLSAPDDRVNNSPWVRVNRSDGSVQVLNPNCSRPYIGLAYNGARVLWGDVGGGGVQRVDELTGNATGPVVVTMFGATNVKWVDLASNPCSTCMLTEISDVGDAPDSTNHYAGAIMTAYPTVVASFPTVFDSQTGIPRGPKHWMAKEDAWLGIQVSGEDDADILPDQDSITNIQPPTNASNQDSNDDAFGGSTIQLPQCLPTTFSYAVTVAGAQRTRFTNAWIDINRDGDWADTLTCTNAQGGASIMGGLPRNGQQTLVLSG